MRTAACPACRHDVPAGRWCNRCGARLVVRDRPDGTGTPKTVVATVATALVVGVGGTVLVLAGDDTGPTSSSAAEVVLDDRAAGPVPDRPADRAGPVRVARPGGSPVDPPSGRVPGPRIEVVCSDLRVRSVPTAGLETTEPGELAHGPCVVMGPEGTDMP